MDNKTIALAALKIPRSTFYYHSRKDTPDELLKTKIESVLVEHASYGHRRIALALKMNKKKIKRLMRKFDIRPRRARKRPTYRDKSAILTASPNLLSALIPVFKNHIWITDFTYIWWRGRFIYLATVIDLYTREVVGAAIKTNHSALLVTEALLNALIAEGAPSYVHSDQGSEYRSKLFRALCTNFSIIPSMSEKGSPWQNGFQESFFGNFKVEIGDVNRFETLGEVIAEIYRSIYYYNNNRIHLSLGCSPKEFAQSDAARYPTVQERLTV